MSMRDFYAPSGSATLDQADGLRRMFGGRSLAVLGLAANAHVAASGQMLDRVAQQLAAIGRRVLVVDAAASAPPPPEAVRLDLAAGIEALAPGVAYLAARGLPLTYVDTRGSAARFVQALHAALPSADVLLLHAEPLELVRLLGGRAARVMLMAADHPESLKTAYAGAKLLHLRSGLATFDLLLAASRRSPRVRGIVASLSSCLENFLGALLHDWALLDPAGEHEHPEHSALARLLRAQISLDSTVPVGAAVATPAIARSVPRADNR